MEDSQQQIATTVCRAETEDGQSFDSDETLNEEEAPNCSLNSTFIEKPKVTLLAYEWGSTRGELSTFIRELAIQLAKGDNIEVCMYLPSFSNEDKNAADECSVHLLKAEEKPGYDPIDWLASIPSDHQMNVVIGHGIDLGKQVPHIKQSRPECKWIQVVHTNPEENEMFKLYDDAAAKGEKKHDTEKKLCQKADQVVAIGPKLADTCSRVYEEEKVLDLTPGIFPEFAYIKQGYKERREFQVFVFGRGDSEDFQLKGYDIAARAVAELKDEQPPVKLMFVGAPNGKEEEVKGMLLKTDILPRQLIVRGAKERGQLAQQFSQADLVIMPSRTEGFGLVAVEALSAGVPVLVSGNTGLQIALEKVPFGKNVVVNSEHPADWAQAIRGVRSKDINVRLRETRDLRENYSKTYNWKEQCSGLKRKIHELAAAAVKVPSPSIPGTTRRDAYLHLAIEKRNPAPQVLKHNARDLRIDDLISFLQKTFMVFFGKNSAKSAIEEFSAEKKNVMQLVEWIDKGEMDEERVKKCIDVFNVAGEMLAKMMGKLNYRNVYECLAKKSEEMEDQLRLAECLTSLAIKEIFNCICTTGLCGKAIERARPNLKKAHRIQTHLQVNKGNSRAQCLAKLGRCLVRSSDTERGKAMIKEAIRIRKAAVQTPNHHEEGGENVCFVMLGATYNDKAVALSFEKHYREAAKIRKSQVMPIYRERLGDHPFTATILNNLSNNYRDMGEFEAAEGYANQALDIRLELLADHRDTTKSLFDLAMALKEKGKFTEAKGFLELYKAMQEKSGK